MKALLTSLMILSVIIIPSSLIAEEKKEKPKVRHSITINIVYNSVTTEEANRITNAIRFAHEEACKCEVSTKKCSVYINSNTITSESVLTFTTQ